MNDIELLQKLELEEQLKFCRGKLNEYKSAMKDICEYKQDFIRLVDFKVKRLEFIYSRYKDTDSKLQLYRMRKMNRIMKELLKLC